TRPLAIGVAPLEVSTAETQGAGAEGTPSRGMRVAEQIKVRVGKPFRMGEARLGIRQPRQRARVVVERVHIPRHRRISSAHRQRPRAVTQLEKRRAGRIGPQKLWNYGTRNYETENEEPKDPSSPFHSCIVP